MAITLDIPLIFGQDMVQNLAMRGVKSHGDSKDKCTEYKVKSSDLETIKAQLNLVEKAVKTDSNLQFTGLFCPSVGSAFLSVLPAPNTYIWDKHLLSPQSPLIVDKTPDGLDLGQNYVLPSTTTNDITRKGFQAFNQIDKLPKKYQNLSFEGCIQLWSKLPKKHDGNVSKMQAYDKVFQVSNSTHRKLYSDFIDYLTELSK